MPDGGLASGPLLGAALGAIPMATGMGKNDYRAGSIEQDGGYNPDAFNYGGSAGAAKAQANYYGAMGAGAQDRQAAQLDPAQMNQSRGAEMDALSMQRDAAMGNAPSVAQMQMQAGMEDNMRQQQSMAAGARGPAAMAMAQYGAAANTANANQGTAFNSSMLRAQEMAAARNAYMGGAQGIRAGDFGQAQANLGAQMQQRGLNDQYGLGMYGLQNSVNQAQLTAQGNQQSMLAQSQANANSINAGANQANANNQKWQWGQIMGGATGGAQMGGMGAGGGGGGGAAGGAGGAAGGEGAGAAAGGIPPIPV